MNAPGLEMRLRERACPVCGSDRSHLRAEASIDAGSLGEYAFASRKEPELMHHRLVTCADCATVYASPAPEQVDLDSAYESASFDSGAEARYAAETYARALRKAFGSEPAAWGQVLDIGTGDGAFLSVLRAQGATELAGIEPSDAPIAAAEPAIRPLIRKGSFDARSFEPGSFGLITCFQTIEHVPDPLELCIGAHRLLRPGGRLAIVCHDYRALVNRLMGKRSPIYDLEHVQLLSRGPVRVLLESAGFSGVEVRRLVNRYPLRYWARLSPLPRPVKQHVQRILQGRAGSPPLPVPVGNLLAVGVRAG